MSIVLILFFIYIVVLAIYYYKPSIQEKYEDEGLPKIIHQTAPMDKGKWKPEWYECQETWKTHFPEGEYKHIMWTDEDLDEFMKKNYPDYYEQYKSYHENIKRIDMARYFILQKMGGIYADMDYKCYKNFYKNLPSDKVSISLSPYPWETMQNALMASPPNHAFWQKVIDKSKDRIDEEVLKSTGPILVSDVYNDNKDMVNTLSVEEYNPHPDTPDHPNLFTRHIGTKSWT